MALLTLVPYAMAQGLAPEGTAFAGFLVNPIDGFSYLAKMRQGLEGGWLFRLPFSSEAGAGVFLYPYYLLLGRLAGLLRLDLITVLHAARLLAAGTMFLCIYRALEEFLPGRRQRWYAYGLCLVGAGWGWMAIPFGFVASDLSIPETTPFLSAYANAHFPVATAAFLAALVAVLGAQAGSMRWRSASAAAGATLAMVLPFVLLPAGVVLLVGLALRWREARGAPNPSALRPHILSLAAFLAGAGPIVAYDAWVLITQPDLAAWTAQNRTPSPPPAAYLLGFAPLLILGVFGLARAAHKPPAHRFLAGWALAQMLLLYAPLALQRRLSLGMFIALAGLAALGAARLTGRRGLLLASLAFASALPSNLLVIAAGLGGVARGEPLLVQTDDEACAAEWLEDHAPADSLVLSGETMGNRLPAQAGVRVLYGHPFETPDAEAERRLVAGLYGRAAGLEGVLPVLQARGVDFVIQGPEERRLGPADWPQELPRAATCGDVIVVEVPAP